jgi:hypothetical protein
VRNANRTGYRTWRNPIFEGNGGRQLHAKHRLQTKDGRVDKGKGRAGTAEDGASDGLEGAIDDEEDAVAEDSGDGAKVREREGREIQIMELHSDNPIALYRGKYFSGSWEHIIGTELLFGTRDDEDDETSTRPVHGATGNAVLRHLPDGVDLLAATDARVTFKRVELRKREKDKPSTTHPTVATHRPSDAELMPPPPRPTISTSPVPLPFQPSSSSSTPLTTTPAPAVNIPGRPSWPPSPTLPPPPASTSLSAEESAILARFNSNGGILIPVTSDKKGKRKPQARFLEDLIAVKRKKGEKDEPTVTVREGLSRIKAAAKGDAGVIDEEGGAERGNGTGRVRRTRRQGRPAGVGRGGRRARGDLRARIDFSDIGLPGWEPRTARGRGMLSVLAGEAAADGGGDELKPESEEASNDETEESGSQPTPARWDGENAVIADEDIDPALLGGSFATASTGSVPPDSDQAPSQTRRAGRAGRPRLRLRGARGRRLKSR